MTNEVSLQSDDKGFDQIIDIAKADSRRRSKAFSHVFAQIDLGLKKLLATPLLQHDEHCQNLMARIARAGTMQEFADRVVDLQCHVGRLMPAVAGVETSLANSMRGAGGANSVAGLSSSFGSAPARCRLRL